MNDAPFLEGRSTWAAKYWQELGAKSPFFRAWFGDWRENDVTPVQSVDLTENKKSAGDSARNKDTGWDIGISSTVIRETQFYNEKRQGHRIHIVNPLLNDCLDNISAIVENAVLLDTRTQKQNNNKKTTAFMHSMYTVVEDKDGNRHVVKLFVEETYNIVLDDVQRKAFQVKEIKIDTRGLAGSEPAKSSPLRGSQRVSNIKTVSDIFSYVKDNDAAFNPKEASKIVDAEGIPLVVERCTIFGGSFN
ncbi:MAG: hypothetical protein IJM42_06615 [Synergistes sp.]|nr:hypothetical protein [Synergistes sp.]